MRFRMTMQILRDCVSKLITLLLVALLLSGCFAGPKKTRVFNTTLGHWDDFEEPAFRKLLVNAFFWALEEPYPKGQDIDKLLPSAVK